MHTLVSTFTSSLLLLGSGFQQRTFLFLWIPELSPASVTSFSQQQLTMTKPQQLSNTLQFLICSAYSISARTAQKTLFLCCSAFVTVETCSFAQRLLYCRLCRGRCLAAGLHITMYSMISRKFFPSRYSSR
jgi:hypothetical protein